MKIKKNEKVDLKYGSSKNILKSYSRFKNYEESYDTIVGSSRIKESYFNTFDKFDTFKEVHRLGKKFYKLIEKPFKDFVNKRHHLEHQTQKGPLFSSITRKDKEIDNSYIEKIFPLQELKKLDNYKTVIEIIKKYCDENGMPIIPKESETKEIEELNITGYPFEISSFVNFCIIFFILFEVGNAINEKLEMEYEDYKKTIDKIKMTDKNKKIIKKYDWFFEFNLENDTFEDICFKYTLYFNFINTKIPYSRYDEFLEVNKKSHRFILIRVHTNIFSIAWLEVKQLLLEHNEKTIKKCKKCDELFETEKNKRADFCQKCSGLNYNDSAKNLYDEKKKKHKIIKELYNANKYKLDEHDEKEIQEIISLEKMKDIKNIDIDKLRKYYDLTNLNKRD